MSTPILGRLKKLYKHKAKWARKNNFQAFRLYERDIPDFPYIIDIYQENALIYYRPKAHIDDQKQHTPLVINAIKEICGLRDRQIFFLERRIQDDEFKYTKEEHTNKEESLIIKEKDLSFKVILGKYIDTGLFLDHRPLRQKLLEQDNGQKSLNLFCYTGSLSVALAKSGSSVCSVDMSNTYLDWAKENFELNDIPIAEHEFVRDDVFKFLISLKSQTHIRNRFNTIVLDPPTFSQSKKMDKTLDIQRDQVELVNNCMAILQDGGVLYFSNNLRDFKIHESLEQKYSIVDRSIWSIPQDFRDQKIHKLFEIRHKN